MAESWLHGGQPASTGNHRTDTAEPCENGLSMKSRGSGEEEPSVERYQIADLTIDVASGAVKRGDEAVILPPLSFDLLVALARRAPHAVRRQDLLDLVWPNEFVSDDTLSRRVRLLREALGDTGEGSRYLESHRGSGYRVVPKVERLQAQHKPIRALAVLPLTNITGDPQQEYFADGMTETLISQLAKIRSLKIISRTSVMHYKHSEKRLPQIARELGVDAVVEGTVFLAEGRVRVSVQLIRAATDEHLWSEIYDRNLADVFALHADLARRIADEVGALVTKEEQALFEKHSRVDPVAHESDLRARFFFGKFTPTEVQRGIACFEQAIARDPSFANAYAGLAHACFERALPLGNDLSVTCQRELVTRAKTAAQQALAIDNNLVEAYAVLGMALLFQDWDWPGAESVLEKALEVDTNSWFAHGFRGVLAATVLDRKRSLTEFRHAVELDPLNLLLRAEAAECCYWVREYSQATAYAAQTLELDPSFPRAHFVLGRVCEAQGRIDEAIDEYQRAGVIVARAEAAHEAFREGGVAGYHSWTLRAEITATPQSPERFRARPFFRARVFARLGEVDEAISYLEQAYEQRECLLVLLKALEWWDPLRSDSRFQDLVRRVGIP